MGGLEKDINEAEEWRHSGVWNKMASSDHKLSTLLRSTPEDERQEEFAR